MPYNNTPIAPSKEVTGHVSLPLARVQKIIQADPERLTVTKNASFAIALATEMMIQHLAMTTHNVVKAERRPRRNIQYRDVSGAVSRTDNLEFLVDVVPKTVQYGAYRRRKAAEEETREKEGVERGEGSKAGAAREGDAQSAAVIATTAETSTETPRNDAQLDPLARKELVPPVPETEAMDIDDEPERAADSEAEEDPAAMQIEMEMRGPSRGSLEGQTATETVGAGTAASAGTAPPVHSGGFTAINGR